MKKIVLALLSLLVIGLFLVSCTPKDSSEDTALAGQAVKKSDSLILKGEYFILSDANQKLHVYLYLGADAPTTDNPKIKLKDVVSGDMITLDYIYQDYAGGIKWGTVLKVGLYQAYASGVDESKDYYLQLTGNTAMKEAINLPFKVCYDSECREKREFKKGTIEI